MDAQVITFGLNGITEEQFRGGVRCGCADVREPSRTAREDLAPGPRDQHLWRSVPVGRPGGVRALHQGRGLQCDQGRREPEGRRVPRLWRLRGSVFTHHAEAARRVSRAGGQSRGECSKAGDASGPARAAVRRRRRPIGVQTPPVAGGLVLRRAGTGRSDAGAAGSASVAAVVDRIQTSSHLRWYIAKAQTHPDVPRLRDTPGGAA
jgi:hypothetical protein